MKRSVKARDEANNTKETIMHLEKDISDNQNNIKECQKSLDNSKSIKPYIGAFGWAMLGTLGIGMVFGANDIMISNSALLGTYAAMLAVCLIKKQLKLNEIKNEDNVNKSVLTIADSIIEKDSKTKELEKAKTLYAKQAEFADLVESEIEKQYNVVKYKVVQYQNNPSTFLKNEIEEERKYLEQLFDVTLETIERDKSFKINDLISKKETYNYKDDYDLDPRQMFTDEDQNDLNELINSDKSYPLRKILKR